jgi:hypothetical protein
MRGRCRRAWRERSTRRRASNRARIRIAGSTAERSGPGETGWTSVRTESTRSQDLNTASPLPARLFSAAPCYIGIRQAFRDVISGDFRIPRRPVNTDAANTHKKEILRQDEFSGDFSRRRHRPSSPYRPIGHQPVRLPTAHVRTLASPFCTTTIQPTQNKHLTPAPIPARLFAPASPSTIAVPSPIYPVQKRQNSVHP